MIVKDLALVGDGPDKTVVTDSTWNSSIVIGGEAGAEIRDLQISGNGEDGLSVGGSAQAVVRDSLIEGNHDNGIFVENKAHLEIYDSTIRDNNVWGIGAALKKCGEGYDDFTGDVIIGDDNQIYGNGKGQVCLPDPCIPNDACG